MMEPIWKVHIGSLSSHVGGPHSSSM